jgi:hypothetical protein
MGLMKNYLASFLNDSARKWLEDLDGHSQAALDLKAVDVDTVLRESIKKICDTISFSEAGRAMALAAQLRSRAGDGERAKAELKKITLGVIERAESKFGAFDIPSSCRSLLYEFYR